MLILRLYQVTHQMQLHQMVVDSLTQLKLRFQTQELKLKDLLLWLFKITRHLIKINHALCRRKILFRVTNKQIINQIVKMELTLKKQINNLKQMKIKLILEMRIHR